MSLVGHVVTDLKEALCALDEKDFNLPSSMVQCQDPKKQDAKDSNGRNMDPAEFLVPAERKPTDVELLNSETFRQNSADDNGQSMNESELVKREKELKEEVAEEVDDDTTGPPETAFEACSTDSDDPETLEICKQSSLSSSEAEENQKLFSSTVCAKRQLSKDKKPANGKNIASNTNSTKLPIQYRRCYICALGCQFGNLECCRVCDNVFHNYCVEGIVERLAGICGSNNCDLSTDRVNSKFTMMTTKKLNATNMADLRANDSFCTKFISKQECLWPEWKLQRSFHNGNRTHLLVPNAVKEAYRNAGRKYCTGSKRIAMQVTRKQDIATVALALQQKLKPSNDDSDSPEEKRLISQPSTFQKDLYPSNFGPIYLLHVDEDLDNILDRKELHFDKGFVSIGTDASKCDVVLSQMESCRSCSPLHCRIFFNSIENRFELLNYSHSGTIVDDVLYCLNRLDPKSSQSSCGSTKSVRSQAASVEVQSFPQCLCTNQVNSDLNHNVSVAWEGSAALSHGTRLTLGCMHLVFAVS